jgi:hypothetical protein
MSQRRSEKTKSYAGRYCPYSHDFTPVVLWEPPSRSLSSAKQRLVARRASREEKLIVQTLATNSDQKAASVAEHDQYIEPRGPALEREKRANPGAWRWRFLPQAG